MARTSKLKDYAHRVLAEEPPPTPSAPPAKPPRYGTPLPEPACAPKANPSRYPALKPGTKVRASVSFLRLHMLEVVSDPGPHPSGMSDSHKVIVRRADPNFPDTYEILRDRVVEIAKGV
jgi:hypothetical protein